MFAEVALYAEAQKTAVAASEIAEKVQDLGPDMVNSGEWKELRTSLYVIADKDQKMVPSAGLGHAFFCFPGAASKAAEDLPGTELLRLSPEQVHAAMKGLASAGSDFVVCGHVHLQQGGSRVGRGGTVGSGVAVTPDMFVLYIEPALQ